jgi:hypothetical protein
MDESSASCGNGKNLSASVRQNAAAKEVDDAAFTDVKQIAQGVKKNDK